MITRLRQRMLEYYGPGSQNRVAEELHINKARLSEYCTGTRKIPAHHLLRLASALQCSPPELLGYVELESVSECMNGG